MGDRESPNLSFEIISMVSHMSLPQFALCATYKIVNYHKYSVGEATQLSRKYM